MTFPRTRQPSSQQRIVVDDTLIEMVTKISEGVPGAVTLLNDLMKRPLPKEAEGLMMPPPFGPLFNLDAEGIYGSNILALSEACGENLDNMLRVLGCLQQGIIDHQEVADVVTILQHCNSLSRAADLLHYMFWDRELIARITRRDDPSFVPDGKSRRRMNAEYYAPSTGLDQPTEADLEEMGQLAAGIDPKERKDALDDLCDRLFTEPE